MMNSQTHTLQQLDLALVFKKKIWRNFDLEMAKAFCIFCNNSATAAWSFLYQSRDGGTHVVRTEDFPFINNKIKNSTGAEKHLHEFLPSCC